MLNLLEGFDVTSTGKPRVDAIIKDPKKYNATVTVLNLSPERVQVLMAKAQGTDAKRAIKRREAMPGFRAKIDNLKKLMQQGVKFNVPFIEVSSGGGIQDGYHRTIAAQELNIKKIPFVTVKRK